MSGRPRTPVEDERARAAAALIVAGVNAAQKALGVDATLDALMVVWLNLAVVAAGPEWTRRALEHTLNEQLGEIALGQMAEAGHG